MKTLPVASMLAIALSLGGCATDGPATNGNSVRAIVASQTIAPQPNRPQTGIDGAAAIEGYKNYVESYDSPRPQLNDSAFRR